MGEPAIPTPAEVAHMLEYARRFVEAVRNDYPLPEGTWIDGEAMPVDEALFALARDLVSLNERHAKLVAAVIEFRDRDRLNYRCPYSTPCGDCPSCRIERVARIAQGVDDGS